MACRVYVIVTMYLDQRAPWTRSLRELSSLGASIVFKDEITRRIVARLDPASLPRLMEILEGRLSAPPVVEVKAYCRGIDVEALDKRLTELGFRRIPGPRGRRTLIGIILGRLVFVEAWRGRLTVKVGARTASKRPTSTPPPSAFQHTVEDAREAVEDAASILGRLGVGGDA